MELYRSCSIGIEYDNGFDFTNMQVSFETAKEKRIFLLRLTLDYFYSP